MTCILNLEYIKISEGSNIQKYWHLGNLKLHLPNNDQSKDDHRKDDFHEKQIPTKKQTEFEKKRFVKEKNKITCKRTKTT